MSSNRISTVRSPAWASVVAIRVSSVTGPLGVCTVMPSTSFRNAVTEVAATEAMPRPIASAAGSGRSSRPRTVSFPRSSIHLRIVDSRPGVSASGCSRSIGYSGPVWEPGATPANDDAYISNSPAPLAFAGVGPTQASTGTSRSATRWARATPS